MFMVLREKDTYGWIPSQISNRKELFGYPDSLITARVAKAYEFVLDQVDVKNKTVLDYGSGYGHGSLRAALKEPKLTTSTGRYKGALIRQRTLFNGLVNNVNFVQTVNHLPFKDGSFDIVFLHHVIEHINQNSVQNFVAELDRITKTNGTISIATPNVNEIIKPEKYGKDYSEKELDKLLANTFDVRYPYSLKANNHALSVHRRKQLIAKIPVTGYLKNLVSPTKWEHLYGSGSRHVDPSDFQFEKGYKDSAIDFLVLCNK